MEHVQSSPGENSWGCYSSGDDWSLGQVVWIFSVAIVSLGLLAVYAGKWLEGSRVQGWSDLSPRAVGGEVLLLALWGFTYKR